MKKLESLNLARLSNLEFGQLLKNTCNELGNLKGTIITDEVVVNYLNVLGAKSGEYDKA